jgi:hypothetical protein
VGALEVQDRTDNAVEFPESAVTYLEILMAELGKYLDAMQLQKKLENVMRDLRASISGGFELMSTTVMRRTLFEMASRVLDTTRSASISVYLDVGDGTKLMQWLHVGDDAQVFCHSASGPASMVYRSKQAFVTGDARLDERWSLDPLDNTLSPKNVVAIMPIVVNERSVGVVYALNKPERYTDEEVAILRSLAEVVSLFLERRDIDDVGERGNVEFDMERWLSTDERKDVNLPSRLQVRADLVGPRMRSSESLAVVFNVFTHANLLSSLEIDVGGLYRTLYRARENSPELPFHCWNRSAETCALVARFVSQGV